MDGLAAGPLGGLDVDPVWAGPVTHRAWRVGRLLGCAPGEEGARGRRACGRERGVDAGVQRVRAGGVRAQPRGADADMG